MFSANAVIANLEVIVAGASSPGPDLRTRIRLWPFITLIVCDQRASRPRAAIDRPDWPGKWASQEALSLVLFTVSAPLVPAPKTAR